MATTGYYIPRNLHKMGEEYAIEHFICKHKFEYITLDIFRIKIHINVRYYTEKVVFDLVDEQESLLMDMMESIESNFE